MLSTTLCGVVAGSVLFTAVLLKLFGRTSNVAKEPPAVHSTIPIIEHLLGMIRHKFFYYQMLRQNQCANFLGPYPGKNLHVVTSPQLVSAVQRMTKTLAFEPVVAALATRVTACSAEAEAAVKYNIDRKQGEQGFLITFSKAIHPSLAPGSALDAMNRTMIHCIATSADALAASPTKRVNLCKWLRHELTMATMYSVYGAENPLANEEIEHAFGTDYDKDLIMLLVNVLPSITARKGSAARATVGKAFERYLNNNGHLRGSALVQAQYNHSVEHSISVADISALENSGCLAALANTFPTAYWMLTYIYSHADVLEECREEVKKITTVTTSRDSKNTHSINITSIKSSCPVITATLQEVLQHTAVGSTVQEVIEDTTLNSFNLKKGNTLLTPANVFHTNSNL